MRICCYKYCQKDISDKAGNVQFCSKLCRGRQKYLRLFIISFKNDELDRWVKIGTNSSYEARLDVYKLFKAQSQRHREV